MDYDVLNRISDEVAKSLTSQDTTDLLNVCSDDVVLHLVGTAAQPIHMLCLSAAAKGVAGSHPLTDRSPSPPGRGHTDVDAKSQQRRDAPQTSRPARGTLRQTSSSPPDSGRRSASGDGTRAPAPPKLRSEFHGIDEVGRATLVLYKWLQAGRTMSEIERSCEVRRPARRVNGPGATAGGVVAVATTLALSVMARHASTMASSQHSQQQNHHRPRGAADAAPVADPTSLSRVDVTFGRRHFKLVDTYYVSDDGVIVFIQRTIVTPDDPTLPAHVADRASYMVMCGVERQGLGAGVAAAAGSKATPAATVAAAASTTVTPAPPLAKPGAAAGRAAAAPSKTGVAVLDYSFQDLKEPMEMLKVTPTSSKAHKPAIIVRKEEENAKMEAIHLMRQEARAKEIVIVKARNRKGEEEAYEIKHDTGILSDPREREAQEKKAELNQLVRQIQKKYECKSLRLCNNLLSDISTLVARVPNVVVNARLTLTWIDLSCNRIESLPSQGLETLPLSTLYLHSNQLGDWENVRTALRRIAGLTTLTLFSNPIATKTVDYRFVAVAMLTGPERPGQEKFLYSANSRAGQTGGSADGGPRGGGGRHHHDNEDHGAAITARATAADAQLRRGLTHLKSLDFVALTAVDRRVASMTDQFSNLVVKAIRNSRTVSPPPQPSAAAVAAAASPRGVMGGRH